MSDTSTRPTPSVTAIRLREAMAEHGITQYQLGQILDKSQSYVSRRLVGEVDWSARDIGLIALHLHLDVARLFQHVTAA